MNTLAVGIFPVIGFGLWNRIRRLNAYGKSAAAASKSLSPQPKESTGAISLKDEKGETVLTADADKVLYLQNSDNYVSVFIQENGSLQEELVRNSMKALSDQLSNTSLMRCHRGYIVNLRKVKEVKGNAAGWRLELKGTDAEVPVSRSYIPTVQEALKGR